MDMLFWFGVVTTSNQENEHVRLAFVSGVGDSRLPNGRVLEAGRECVCGLHQAAGKRDSLSPVWIERGGAKGKKDAFVYWLLILPFVVHLGPSHGRQWSHTQLIRR